MKRWQRIKAELAHRLRRKRARKQRIWARRMLDTPRHLWPAGVSGYAVHLMANERPYLHSLLAESGAHTYNWPIVHLLAMPMTSSVLMQPATDMVVSATAEEIRQEISRRGANGLEGLGEALTVDHIRATRDRLRQPGYATAGALRDENQAAYQRARATLQLFLTDTEQAQLSEHGYFDVPSKLTPNRVYRIPLRDGVVSVYDNGKETMTICCRPEDDSVPWPDVMLAYKLGLQADEVRWLATANKWGATADGRSTVARIMPSNYYELQWIEIDPLTVATRSDADGLVEVIEEWHP